MGTGDLRGPPSKRVPRHKYRLVARSAILETIPPPRFAI